MSQFITIKSQNMDCRYNFSQTHVKLSSFIFPSHGYLQNFVSQSYVSLPSNECRPRGICTFNPPTCTHADHALIFMMNSVDLLNQMNCGRPVSGLRQTVPNGNYFVGHSSFATLIEEVNVIQISIFNQFEPSSPKKNGFLC